MLIIKKYTSYFLAGITFLFFELFVTFPKGLPYVFVIYAIFLFLALWNLQNKKLKKIKKKVVFYILPFFTVINFIIFLLYLNVNKSFLHIITFLAGVIIWLYVESFFLKHYFSNFYKLRSFENMVENIVLINAFLLYVNFFSSHVYIGWSYYSLLAIALISLFVLNWIHLTLNNLSLKKNFLVYLIVLPILSLEIIIVSIFLPTNFYSIALINAIFFYIFITFSRYHLADQLSAKKARSYLSFSLVLLILIFLFSNWT